MSYISAFDLKYYNQNYYSKETLNSLPALIEKNKDRVARTKMELEQGQPFASKDGYEDAKAYHYQASELLNLAKNEYKKQLTNAINTFKTCVKLHPEVEAILTQQIESFQIKLGNV